MSRKGLLVVSMAAAAAAVAGLGPHRPADVPAPVLSGAPAHAVPAARGPSVVLVVARGVSAEPGSPEMPNLDRLAARGRRFERAFAQYPIPAASLTSLMTGWRPEKTGVWGDPTERVEGATPLQEHFQANGYWTARVGPLYGGPAEGQFRWDRAEEAAGEDAAGRAAQILGERRDRPAFLAVTLGSGGPAPSAAGTPSSSPGTRDRAGSGDLPAIALGPLDALARPGGFARARPLSADERTRLSSARAVRASAVDKQIGVIVDALDRLGRGKDAVVVVVGDVGVDGGAHGALPRTDTLFEDALHVPLVIAAPPVARPGTGTAAVVELLDVYPTLVALAGLPSVDGLEGTSLRPLLESPEAAWPRAAFSAVGREAGQIGRSLRTARYRYTEWPDGSEELYDHETDPGEFTNLARGTAPPTPLPEMRRLLASRYRARTARASAPSAGEAAGRRPRNVLFVVFDDLGSRIGAYGAPVQTPNIDRLAARGRIFQRAYAQVAMCSPSRSSLLSGWRPERTDVWNNLTPVRQHLEGARPLQEYFHAHGYFTARVGKVYEGAMSDQFDWDSDDETTGPTEEPRRDDDTVRGAWWVATEAADASEPDGARARQAAQILERHKDRPFFLAVGFSKPHLKWTAPRKYFDLYPPDRIGWPAEPADDLAGVPAIAIKNRPQERPGVPLAGREPPGMIDDPKFRREATAAYSATVTFVDAQLGILLDTLDRLALWDSTIVVVLGDHGFHLGEHHGLWRKDTLFEEALRTPLVIAAPQVRKPGLAAASPVELLDVYPTVVDLAGLGAPGGLDGASLRPLLEDPTLTLRPGALSFRKAKPPPLGVSVRADRYRYTQWPDGSEELYDHHADPAETRNLARDPASAEALDRMRRLRVAGPGGRP